VKYRPYHLHTGLSGPVHCADKNWNLTKRSLKSTNVNTRRKDLSREKSKQNGPPPLTGTALNRAITSLITFRQVRAADHTHADRRERIQPHYRPTSLSSSALFATSVMCSLICQLVDDFAVTVLYRIRFGAFSAHKNEKFVCNYVTGSEVILSRYCHCAGNLKYNRTPLTDFWTCLVTMLDYIHSVCLSVCQSVFPRKNW